jgi:hypothetical protein
VEAQKLIQVRTEVAITFSNRTAVMVTSRVGPKLQPVNEGQGLGGEERLQSAREAGLPVNCGCDVIRCCRGGVWVDDWEVGG